MSDDRVTLCLVVYDIVNDRVRQRVSDACLDFGLERFQFSAFSGYLGATRRRELFLKLKELLGPTPGRILIQPISDDDLDKRLAFQQESEENDDGDHGSRHEWREPGADRPTIQKF
ncbi:MAG: CRISPR-associated endonuclease Cas2 [Nitrospira sp.]|nr:CRISPR-associated endonuclease Cas2 [Nitrospira sp.]